MIYQICDVTMSISTWDMVHFWIYLLSHKSLTHQTWSIDRPRQEQWFSEVFWATWRTRAKFQVLFSLLACSSYSVNNYTKIPMFHFLKKVNKGQLKMVNDKWWTIKNGQISLYCHFDKIIKGSWTELLSTSIEPKIF